MAKVLIPTALKNFTAQNDTFQLDGKNVGEALTALTSQFSALKPHLFTADGSLRSFVNVYVNDEDIRFAKNLETPIKESDEISIVPSIAGGADLTHDEIKRYSRHLIMPEVGMEGQRKLKEASILLIGTGGLGAPLGLYLAAAGIGRLGLVDFDVVDFTNLQRQVIHGTKDVGRPKLQSAKDRINDINPFVKLDLYETHLSSENALDIIKKYDIVIDGTDNFPTRYLVNDACVLLGKPNVYGSIFRFEGQASVFDAKRGPCYRCLYNEPPPPGLVPSCAEGGVLGVLPGIVGTIQATEAIKLIIGNGEPLIGRLLLFDALKMRFREVKLKKDPKCPICGPNPTVTQLIDYNEFCGITRGGSSDKEYETGENIEIDPMDLKEEWEKNPNLVVVDVREPHEYDIVHIEGTKLIPLSNFANHVHELNTADEIVLHCHHGGRSMRALNFLKDMGFKKLKNLRGGIDAWADQVDPSMARY